MILVDEVGHMVSTASADELHAFACKLGLKRQWYQATHRPHYDLTTARMRCKAISMGAKSVTSYEVVKLAWWHKGRKPSDN